MCSTYWLQVQIDLGSLSPEPAEEALLALGALSVEYHDAGKEAILEPPPGTTPLWREIKLVALFSGDTHRSEIANRLLAIRYPGDPPAIQFSKITDRNWISAWQDDARPMQFGNRLHVYPSNYDRPDKGATVLLDPGLAFGTGSHATTALCLEWLAGLALESSTILDFGCGSGILAIAGLALGSTQACAVDIDPQALMATRENARRNKCLNRIRIAQPADLRQKDKFDTIVANILSGALIRLASQLQHHANSGARIGLSGILSEQAPDVRRAFAGWVEFDTTYVQEGWVLLTGQARQ
jgi:ribosomal protein L11 methyltransferase